MHTIHQIIQNFSADTAKRFPVRTNAPANLTFVHARFAEFGHSPPHEVLEFYSLTDGLDFGTFGVCPIEETYWLEPNMLSVHEWGNGDCDCLRIESYSESAQDASNPIVFLGHDPAWRFLVTPSLGSWLEKLYAEFQQVEYIPTPLDCYNNGIKSIYTPPDYLTLQ